jgi:hypothetical protein
MRVIHALFFLTFCFSGSTFSFSPGTEMRRNIDFDPKFVPLELDEEVYTGIIYDEKSSFEVINLSFGGITKVLGVRNDNDDSNNIIRLSQIKSIKIIDPNYRSPRHTTNANMLFFIQVQVVHNTPHEVTDVMLIPHDVTLCAEDRTTGIEKAWRLRDITSVTVHHSATGPEINRAEQIGSAQKRATAFAPQKPFVRKIIDGIWGGLIDITYGSIKQLRSWLGQ